ncbi:MAG: hypothetical protein FRX49_00223 [Trebouxia sp. A1-2]|nr:MAG: hypothetical protein FRX49_00223 [Trebouxia sp. A1-2]
MSLTIGEVLMIGGVLVMSNTFRQGQFQRPGGSSLLDPQTVGLPSANRPTSSPNSLYAILKVSRSGQSAVMRLVIAVPSSLFVLMSATSSLLHLPLIRCGTADESRSVSAIFRTSSFRKFALTSFKMPSAFRLLPDRSSPEEVKVMGASEDNQSEKKKYGELLLKPGAAEIKALSDMTGKVQAALSDTQDVCNQHSGV